jgi:hypothetical protein
MTGASFSPNRQRAIENATNNPTYRRLDHCPAISSANARIAQNMNRKMSVTLNSIKLDFKLAK